MKEELKKETEDETLERVIRDAKNGNELSISYVAKTCHSERVRLITPTEQDMEQLTTVQVGDKDKIIQGYYYFGLKDGVKLLTGK